MSSDIFLSSDDRVKRFIDAIDSLTICGYLDKQYLNCTMQGNLTGAYLTSEGLRFIEKRNVKLYVCLGFIAGTVFTAITNAIVQLVFWMLFYQ